MRPATAAVTLSILICSGCGYVGPVLPPSPEIPAAVTNLSVVERGAELEIDFNTPARTTDSLAITEFENIELRVGPAAAPFDFNSWATTAKPYDVDLPSPSDRDDPQPKPIHFTIPASDWTGQHVAVAVRTSIRRKDHYSAWSNRVVLDVLKPLQAPPIQLESTANGISVSWKSAPDTHYQVLRQGPADKSPIEVGSTDDSFFVDATAHYDTPYQYSLVAKIGSAESLPSKAEKPIIAKDIFAPSVPASITALAGPLSIEVSWQRSPESDLKGYYVYRSTSNGPYQRQGTLLDVPAYTDHSVERGKTYSYQVSAVDLVGNESTRSKATEIAF